LHKYFRLPVVIVSSLWWLSASLSLPTLADPNLQAPQDYEDLGRAEKLFFGKVDTTDTFLKRLDFLEVGIFGRVRSGSAEKRFLRIADALGLELTPNSGHSDQTANQQAAVNAPGTGSGTGVAAGPQNVVKETGSNCHFTDTTTGSAASLNELLNNVPQTTDSKTGSPNNSATASGQAATTADKVAGASGAAGTPSSPSSQTANSASSFSSPPASPSTAQPASSDSKPATTQNLASVAKPSTEKSSTSASSANASRVKTTAGTTAKAPKNTKTQTVVLGKETPKIAVVEPPKVDAPTGTSAPKSEHRLERPSTAAQKPGSRDAEIDALFKQGMEAFKAHRSKEAQTAFKQILTLDPRNVDAYYNLGSLAEGNKEYLDALTYYKAALSSSPGDKDLKKAVASMEQLLLKRQVRYPGGKPANSAGSTASGAPKSAPATKSAASPGRNYDAADSGVRYTPTADVPMGSPPIIPAGQTTAPVTDIGTTDAPVVPAKQLDPKTFSLQTAQNGALVPFGSGMYQVPPITGVPNTLSGNVPGYNYPVGSIAPSTPNHPNMGYIIQAGAGFALRGTGLHCPICRIMGGLH
jgi:hypothetical protein